MVIDCHYHLEERALSRADLLREMDRAGVDRVALMGSIIEPVPEPPRILLRIFQTILEQRATRILGRLLVANFTSRGEVKILGKPFPIIVSPDNASVFEAVREHPDRFLGRVFINPRSGENQLAELKKYENEPGFIGVKAHPFWHHFTPIELLPAARRLAELGKPLLIHCGFGKEGNFSALIDAVPDLKLILAHTGFPEYSDTWRAVADRRNVYLDVSQTSYVSEKATRDSVSLLGADRLLFGTDGPYGFHDREGRYDYGFIKNRIMSLFPRQEVHGRILGGNFAKLTGLA